MSDLACLASQQRSRSLDEIEGRAFDLLVIGGGITGAGVAREATLRGLSVALVEANDFASGTSGRSSKLIHGGLRYLAMGDVKLVRETALERKRLRRLVPHLAEPRWMLAPAHSRAGLMKFRAAITLYEKLGAVTQADRHRNWHEDDLREHEPLLDRSAYAHACAYREYLTDDARLVVANLRAAARDGALALNYLRVEAIRHESQRAVGVSAACTISGRKVEIRAKSIINAAGPWVEELMALDAGPGLRRRLHLSKGVHIVVDRERLPVRNLVIMGTEDKRSIFAIARGPSVYVGTTDTSYQGEAKTWPAIERADVEYLLKPISRTFACDPIRPDEVVAAWSGLRPLIADADKAAHEISRRDEIWVGTSGIVTIAGGKLTGYRRMAEDVVDRALEVAPALSPRACVGEEKPLPGGDFDGDLDALARPLVLQHGQNEARAHRLVRLYGSEAEQVTSLGRDTVVAGGDIIRGEISWAIEREAAAGLEDILYRRTRAALYHAGECEALLEPVSKLLQSALDWSEGRRAREVASVRDRLRLDLAFREADPEDAHD